MIAHRYTQIIKNLVFLAKTLQILDGKTESRMENGQHTTVAPEENISAKEGTGLTLTALLNNMNKLATLEASQTPKHTKKVSTNDATISFSLFYSAVLAAKQKQLWLTMRDIHSAFQ